MSPPVNRVRGIRQSMPAGHVVGRSDGGDGAPHPVKIGSNMKMVNRTLDTDLKLTDGHIFVGDAQGRAADVALSGDATILDTGALKVTGLQNVPVSNTAPTNLYVLTYDSGTGMWKPAPAAGAGVIALTSAHILVGNGSNLATDVAMSGDVTIANTGATTIGAGKVTEAMQVLADNTTQNVSTSKHGYAPKAPNDATKFLNGAGAYAVPAGSTGASLLLTELQRSTNQSIANNTTTSISWDTSAIRDDVGAFSAGSPTLVTVPVGYTRVKITVNLNWASNSTGVRFVIALKNGATVTQPSVIVAAAFESCATATSPWLTVTAGDTLEIQVRQSSGGNLNLNGGSGTFNNTLCEFEWLP